MACIHPFPALRPRPDLAPKICELPYDVMSSDEARILAEGNPWSFLRASKGEINLPSDVDPHAPQVYDAARTHFERLQRNGGLVRDDRPGIHVYQLQMGTHVQTGIVGTFSCQEYLEGVIRKHELTRPDKEDDRVRHIEVLQAQTGPVFLTCRAEGEINRWVADTVVRPPAVDYTAVDRIRHRAWTEFDPVRIRVLQETFAAVPRLYIADGHHRSAAAARVCLARGGRGGSDRFLAVIFPHSELQILPYNRVVRDLNGRSDAEFLKEVGRVARVRPAESRVPSRRGTVNLLLGGQWHELELSGQASEAVDRLDVAVLQRTILGPILGIADPRTSERIAFVGGIRGTAELERMVDGSSFACAFAMFPTGVSELMEVADANGIMPPKSTWFEPKLRDGMFSHLLDPA